MDKGGEEFSFITSSWRVILGIFLIISLPLLLYRNSTSNSVWSLRRGNNTFPRETTPDVASSPSQAPPDYSHSVAPAAPPKPSGTTNSQTPPDYSQAPPDYSLAVAPAAPPTASVTKNHTVKESRNVSTPSIVPKSLNQTMANSTNTSSLPTQKSENHTMPSFTNGTTTEDRLLNGLLPDGFDKQSCLSRYESHLYRKPSPHRPSPRLLSKLRSYERLHRRCGPHSRQYSSTLRMLGRTKSVSNSLRCSYIVWIPVNGLGNRMISLAATFLYAVLTNRVLLLALADEMSGVFCEPFLNSTWKLPHDFPHRHQLDHLPTYSSLLDGAFRGGNISNVAYSIDVPPFVFVHLQHESPERERLFNCDEGQAVLNRAPFLILRSDQYFVPSLFMIPSFEQEINAMFPEKDMVFHHLGRYLFSPSNEAWRQITRFYKANLLKADKKVGIQVRVFAPQLTPAKTVTEQILACTLKNNILPNIDHMKNASKNSASKTKAVLVTSLYKDYSENLSAIYKMGPTTTGEAVRVYQPSHEEVQRFNNNAHHVKALIEMYLLSLCDELVTSGQSTFGYVAQGLGAMKPWIMDKTIGNKFRDPPCVKALSMEPCFHFPPRYDCKRRIKVEHLSSVFTHMRRCEDIGTGMKMVSEA